MITEVQRGVVVTIGLSALILFGVGLFMIYPPTLQYVDGSFYSLLKVWWLLVIVGGVYFLCQPRLNVAYLIWTNLVTCLALLYTFMMFHLIYTVYGIVDWAYNLTIVALVICSIYQLIGRFVAGGYRECVEKGRVIRGTFYFHIDNHVDSDFSRGKVTPWQKFIGKSSVAIAGFGGALGGVLSGTSMIGSLLALCMSIACLAFSFFFFRFLFPDLLVCLMAGFDKNVKCGTNEYLDDD